MINGHAGQKRNFRKYSRVANSILGGTHFVVSCSLDCFASRRGELQGKKVRDPPHIPPPDPELVIPYGHVPCLLSRLFDESMKNMCSVDKDS